MYAVAAAKLAVVTVHVIVVKLAVPVAGVHAATEAVSAVVKFLDFYSFASLFFE